MTLKFKRRVTLARRRRNGNQTKGRLHNGKVPVKASGKRQ